MTVSPTFTSIGTRCPSSNRPGPTAMTSPSWGFSLAVSGITMPETVVCSYSLGSTAMRSSSGFNPNFLPIARSFHGSWVVPAGGRRLRLLAGGTQDLIEHLPMRAVGWPRRRFLEPQWFRRSGEREDDRVTFSREPCGEAGAVRRRVNRRRHGDVPSGLETTSMSLVRNALACARGLHAPGVRLPGATPRGPAASGTPWRGARPPSSSEWGRYPWAAVRRGPSDTGLRRCPSFRTGSPSIEPSGPTDAGESPATARASGAHRHPRGPSGGDGRSGRASPLEGT